jgi:hypothetical protein
MQSAHANIEKQINDKASLYLINELKKLNEVSFDENNTAYYSLLSKIDTIYLKHIETYYIKLISSFKADSVKKNITSLLEEIKNITEDITKLYEYILNINLLIKINIKESQNGDIASGGGIASEFMGKMYRLIPIENIINLIKKCKNKINQLQDGKGFLTELKNKIEQKQDLKCIFREQIDKIIRDKNIEFREKLWHEEIKQRLDILKGINTTNQAPTLKLNDLPLAPLSPETDTLLPSHLFDENHILITYMINQSKQNYPLLIYIFDLIELLLKYIDDAIKTNKITSIEIINRYYSIKNHFNYYKDVIKKFIVKNEPQQVQELRNGGKTNLKSKTKITSKTSKHTAKPKTKTSGKPKPETSPKPKIKTSPKPKPKTPAKAKPKTSPKSKPKTTPKPKPRIAKKK